MPTIKINDQEYEVKPNQNLIQAAGEVGITIPHYCYHPGLSIDGNCRMCLVEVNSPRGWMSQIACNTFVSDNLEVRTQSENVEKMRQGVLEFLLLNHPIDCPICDQAGECKLQDFYMEYGRYDHRSTVPKVHKKKVVDVGPLVVLDQERCILCSRCVRFCQQITHSNELVIVGRGENCRIETFPGKELDNPYSGNVVDICPVGALTSKDFRFKQRVWFLSKTQSICTGCARGCNIELDYNANENRVYRYRPRHNPHVNNYWMCDQGRLSYKQIHTNRLDKPLKNGAAVSLLENLTAAQDALKKIREHYGKQAIGALASSTASLEDNFVLKEMVNQTLDRYNLWGPNYVPEAESDDFLFMADQTPNSQGLAFLEINGDREKFEKALGSGTIRCLIVLDNPCLDEKVLRLIEEKVQTLIVFSTHQTELAKMAHYAFPITTHAEHYASYINAQDILQKVNQAYHPQTDIEPAWMCIGRLFKALDETLPDYQDVENVWAALRDRYEVLSGMTFYKLPDTGLKLKQEALADA